MPRRRDKATTNVSETGKTVMSAADRVKVTLEVRWFVRGELPTGRGEKGASRHRRTDHYYLPSLSERFSLKRRGGGSLERKERLGVPIPVTGLGGDTPAERWAKYRTATMPATDARDTWRDGDLTAVRHARPLGDRRGDPRRRESESHPWIGWQAVDKRVWQWRGLQLAEIVIDDETWWTMAVIERGGAFRDVPPHLRILREMAGGRPSGSYPSWLLRTTAERAACS